MQRLSFYSLFHPKPHHDLLHTKTFTHNCPLTHCYQHHSPFSIHLPTDFYLTKNSVYPPSNIIFLCYPHILLYLWSIIYPHLHLYPPCMVIKNTLNMFSSRISVFPWISFMTNLHLPIKTTKPSVYPHNDDYQRI